jgi:uncharacterized protein
MKNIVIPLFPLNGVIFFPQSNLPLNIFENRYLSMINYSLKSDRLIGMIQMNKNTELYNLGCVGKINSFTETDDGRFVINLIGQNYFNLINKLPDTNKFILANVKIISNKINNDNKDLNSFNKNLLIEKYKKYIQNKNIQVDTSFIQDIDLADLIKFISMSCPFSVEDKQMLLETLNIAKLGEKTLNLLEFYLQNSDSKTVN